MINSLTIGDLHSHALINMAYLRKDLGRRGKPPLFWNPLRNQIDIPRLKEAGVDFQVFTVYVPFGFPWKSPFHAAQAQIAAFEDLVRRNSDKIGHARTAEEVKAINSQGKIAALLAVEGGHHLNGQMENLEYFAGKGAIYLTLTHFIDNGIAGASLTGNRGLTDFGRDVLKAMGKLRILPDVAHCSERSFKETGELYDGPVISTHSGARKFCTITRNLSDEQMTMIAQKGGLTGVIFYSLYLKRLGVFSGIQQIAETARYIRDRVGPRTLCFGSDLDGYILTVRGARDVTAFPRIIDALKRVLSQDELRAMAGENILRVLEWRDHA